MAGIGHSTSGRLGLARVMDDTPHSLGGEWHFDLRDAEFRERVDYRIDDCGETAGTARLAAALGTQRIGFRERRMIADRHQRNILGARHRVVHE